MKKSVVLLVSLFVLLATFLYPAVMAAQTTEISQVVSPESITAGSVNPIPITTTVTYNAMSGYQLIVGILDAELSPQTPVPGVVISSTDPCLNQGEPAAFCVVTLQKQSGEEQVSFQIGGIFGGKRTPGKWNLNVTSELLDLKSKLVPGSVNSRLLQIELVPVSLTVIVPSSVEVTIDGVQQPNGLVTVGVALGQHNLTVPLLVPINQTVRMRFNGWSDGYPSPLRNLIVSNSTSLQALYRAQYLLTLTGLEPNATTTWYDANSTATLSANQYQPATGLLGALGARLSFQGWYENNQLITNSPAGTIAMNEPHTVNAVWQVDYSIPTAVAAVIVVVAIALFLIARRTLNTSARSRGRQHRKRQ